MDIVYLTTSYSNKAVISLTHGSEYQYQYDNNKTCIEVKTDVMFTLTNGTETIKFDGTNFTVKSGDCALPSESVATLTLTTAKEDFLSLEFKIDAQNEASMGARFTFSPDEYFPGSPSASEFSDVYRPVYCMNITCNPAIKGFMQYVTNLRATL